MPNERYYLYYIRFKNRDEFEKINPQLGKVKLHGSEGYPQWWESIDYEPWFKTKFYYELADCESIRSKVLTGFYSGWDLPAIVKEYNNCK